MLRKDQSAQHPAEIKSEIVESKKFSDLLIYSQDANEIFLDLDNTLVHSVIELGTDQWFSSLWKDVSEIILDKEEHALVVLTIYNAVQHQTQFQKVEQDVVNIIESLKNSNKKVFAITARGNEIIEPTLNQLKKLEIKFSSTGETFSLDVPGVNKNIPTCKDGVIFCNGQDKGKCLEAYYKHFEQKPKKAVIVDDKKNNVVAVQTKIVELGGSCVGIRYGYMDEVVAQFETQGKHKAHQQLMMLCKNLPQPAQDVLEKYNILPNICFFKPRNSKTIIAKEEQVPQKRIQ